LRTAFNKGCGALAADRDITGCGTSTDAREANQKAIDDCRKAGGARCVLHISFCSF
jgi:polygalacturonase